LGNFTDVPASHGRAALGAPSRLQDRPVHRSLVRADLAAIRARSSLPLVLEGILTAEDARLALEHGVDAIVVSNHGARQLDRVPAGVGVLAEGGAAVGGRTAVWGAGGVRRGVDIAIARALGAQGVLVGRPMYWALAAGGAVRGERAIASIVAESASRTQR